MDRFVGQRGRQHVEEQTEGPVVSRGGLNETLRRRDSRRNRAQRVGGDVDALAELALDARDRLLISRAKP
jgi:hypothetical protein